MTLVQEAQPPARMPGAARPVPPPLKVGDTLLLERQDYYGSPFGDNDSRALVCVVAVGADLRRLPTLEWLGATCTVIDRATGRADRSLHVLLRVATLHDSLVQEPHPDAQRTG